MDVNSLITTPTGQLGRAGAVVSIDQQNQTAETSCPDANHVNVARVESQALSSALSNDDHQVSSHQSGLAYDFGQSEPSLPTASIKRSMQLGIKRIFDVSVASLSLFALSPFFLFAAIAIKLTDGGPVLFKQMRTGLDGEQFKMFKFRSMYIDKCDPTGVEQTKPDDDRITPIGKLIRRTNFDELPQLINIVLGDMSLIGPRPHVEGMLAAERPYDEFVPYYKLRHNMRPGLTGWAQANGLRGPTDDPVRAKARVDHDIAYIQRFSLWLDIKTLFLTVRHELLNSSGF